MGETLLVLPNPYTFIDVDGEAQGTCARDSDEPGTLRVGAEIDRKRTMLTEKFGKGDPRHPAQVTKYIYATEPEKVTMSGHYLYAIRHGDLVAGDEATWNHVFPGKAFVKPEDVLAKAKADAIKSYQANYGKLPAFAVEAKPVESEPKAGGKKTS